MKQMNLKCVLESEDLKLNSVQLQWLITHIWLNLNIDYDSQNCLQEKEKCVHVHTLWNIRAVTQ